MKKTDIITTVYTLSEEEYRVVEKCLRYTKHRLTQHVPCGAHKAGIILEDINKLIK